MESEPCPRRLGLTHRDAQVEFLLFLDFQIQILGIMMMMMQNESPNASYES